MAHKLSTEIQTAIQQNHGEPLEVVDEAGGTYVVVPKTTYVHLSNLSSEADEESKNQLRRLIQEGIDSGPRIPADELFEELRRVAQSLDARET